MRLSRESHRLSVAVVLSQDGYLVHGRHRYVSTRSMNHEAWVLTFLWCAHLAYVSEELSQSTETGLRAMVYREMDEIVCGATLSFGLKPTYPQNRVKVKLSLEWVLPPPMWSARVCSGVS